MHKLLILLGLLTLVAGCATGPAAPPHRPAASASIDRGRFFVLRSCAGCHAVGPLGSSPNGSAPSFGAVRLRFNALSLEMHLKDISRNGHVEMPPIYMSGDEIQDIIAYIQTVETSAGSAVPPGGERVRVAQP